MTSNAIKVRNQREFQFLRNKLVLEHNAKYFEFDSEDSLDLSMSIERKVDLLAKEGSSAAETYIKQPQELRKLIEESLIDESHFQWIKESGDRCCNWVWALLRVQREEKDLLQIYSYQPPPLVRGRTKRLDSHSSRKVVYKPLNTLYDELKVFSYPSNSKGRFRQIIAYIDLINLSCQEKISVFGKIQSRWSNELCFQKKFKWLNINSKEDCLWAYKLVCKHLGGAEHLLLKATNHTECYWAILAQLDLYLSIESEVWSVKKLPEGKETMLVAERDLYDLLTNAWKQRRRQKRNKKAAVTISVEHKRTLQKFAKSLGISAGKAVEHMIDIRDGKPIPEKWNSFKQSPKE